MKSGVAMMVTALLRLKAAGVTPAGDVTLCLLADEEAGGDYGARYLVSEHPQLFEGIQYGLGEFGGFTLRLGGTTFYPIQVAEKLQCRLRLTIEGPAGHGSQPVRGGAMARLGRVLTDLDHKRTPIHITPGDAPDAGSLAEHSSGATAFALRQLLHPRLADLLLEPPASACASSSRSCATRSAPPSCTAGRKINVIPGQITLDCDGRMLPGFTPAQMVAEVQDIVGHDVQIDVLHYDPPASGALDMSQFACWPACCASSIRPACPSPTCCPPSPTPVTSPAWASSPMALCR